MAQSDIEICNLALGYIKGGRITAFDGSSEEAKLCERYYSQSRDQVFEEHNWNVLTTRVVLSPDSTPPAFGFTNRFPIPADPFCIRITEITDAGGTAITDYKIEGRYILANVAQINLVYIGRVTDVTIYNPMLVACIARRLAGDISFSLTGASSAVQLNEDLYRKMLDEARSLDTSQGATGATYVDHNYLFGYLD